MRHNHSWSNWNFELSDFQVSQYDLQLIPDLEFNFTTSGKVDIYITTTNDINQDLPFSISLHTKQIKILEESVSVAHANDPDITLDVTGHEYDIDRSFYVIHLAQVYNQLINVMYIGNEL